MFIVVFVLHCINFQKQILDLRTCVHMFVSGLFTVRTTKLDVCRFKKMFEKITRFRPFSTLVLIFFLYEHFGHNFLFKGYKEKHSLRYSYQTNYDLISNCSNKNFG